MRHVLELLRKFFGILRSRALILFYKQFYGIDFGKGVRIYSKILIHGDGEIIVGEGTCFTSRRAVNELITVKSNAKIRIGRNCNLNGVKIGSAESISIGENCIIAEAYIRDTSSHGISPHRRRDPSAVKIAPVVLEDNVWIGSSVHVMPGVTIGENSVIGVNSVVTRSIPKNVFAAGNPARVIKLINDMN
ncbi:acyltransferase [Thermodesulfobacteriota bacterium]